MHCLRADGPRITQIYKTMRDLGLDCTLARIRRIKIQFSRLVKSGKRSQALGKLKIGAQSCRVRLYKGSVVSSAMGASSPGNATFQGSCS